MQQFLWRWSSTSENWEQPFIPSSLHQSFLQVLTHNWPSALLTSCLTLTNLKPPPECRTLVLSHFPPNDITKTKPTLLFSPQTCLNLSSALLTTLQHKFIVSAIQTVYSLYHKFHYSTKKKGISINHKLPHYMASFI
jgi:hypothetical protein